MPAESSLGAIVDERLAERSAAGDMEAFAKLVDRYQHRLYGLALRMLGQREEAEDAAQEAFIKIYRSLGRYRPADRFAPWAYRITSNVCIDRLRKRQVQAVSLDAPTADAAGEGEMQRQIPDWSAAPEKVILEREGEAAIMQAINKLPPNYKLVMLLRHAEDLTYEDIATITGLPLGTVKNRLFRAREMLRRGLPQPSQGPGARSVPS